MTGTFKASWQTDVRNRIFEFVEKGKLVPARGFVLLRLMEYADYHCGEEARPGLERLERVCGMTERTVTRALQDGKALRLIEETKHGGGSGVNARASEFRFLSPVLSAQPAKRTARSAVRIPARSQVDTSDSTSAKRTALPTRPTDLPIPTNTYGPTPSPLLVNREEVKKEKAIGTGGTATKSSVPKRTVKVRRSLATLASDVNGGTGTKSSVETRTVTVRRR